MAKLIRIVRMTFRENDVEDFLMVFNDNRQKIRSFPGCEHLELHQDYYRSNVYSTYSLWEDDQALENYRKSALFKSVWSKTKPLFAEKPVAFSHKIAQQL